MSISIIIPAYNEENLIAHCLDCLSDRSNSVEVLVVDQSSWDETQEIVAQYPTVRYVRSEWDSRPSTMNHWAREATGDILLFLHVDCLLPENFEEILDGIDFETTPWWGFERAHHPSLIQTRIADWFGKHLARRLWYMLWDNALVVRKDIFDEVWWYWEKKLFEDVHLCEVLRKKYKRFFVKQQVICSSRKFTSSGPWKAFWLMFIMQILYQFGLSVEPLIKRYRLLKN